MAESVADVLGRLRFVSGPVESLYLNEVRVKEGFIGHLGAIESFSRTASKQGTLELPVIKAGAGVGSQGEVTWNLTDPVAQALVLRASLEAAGSLTSPAEAEPGRYVWWGGRGLISCPGMFDDLHRTALAQWPGVYEGLEAERAGQEKVLKMIEGETASMWLLTIDDGDSLAAAVLDNRWLSPGFPSWLAGEGGTAWDVLALFRRRDQRDVPLLAVLHVIVSWTSEGEDRAAP